MIALILAAALFVDPVFSVANTGSKAQVVPAPVSEQSQTADLQGVAVTLECTARITGRVDACTVLGETHPGMGFGQAALALMKDAEVGPQKTETRFAKTILFTP